MNLYLSSKRGVGCLPCTTFLLVSLIYSLAAQTAVPKTNAPPKLVTERFLLIVDTSVAMKKRAANVEQVVGSLFASGLGGQLHGGDTIGVWTYTDDLQAGQFPLQRWTPQASGPIAQGMVDFLKSRKYEKTANLAPVIAQMKSVVADSDKITVLLISDGESALIGTPYDAPIAEAYRTNAADQRKQQMPFLTVLRAVKGKFIGFTVNTPPWPIEFPKFPAEPQLKASAAPTPKAKPESAPEPKPESKVEIKPQPQIELPPVSLATNPAPTTNALPAASVPAAEIKPPSPPVIAPTPPIAVSNPPPLIPAPKVMPNSNPVVQPRGVDSSAEGNHSPLAALVVGSVLLLGIVAGVIFWQLRSRSKPRASLITRSIDRELK